MRVRTVILLISAFFVVAPFALGETAAPFSAPVVQAFAVQPHATTAIPHASAHYKAELLAARIKDQDVIRVETLAKPSQLPQIISVDFARGAGLAPISWRVRLADGREFNLTGAVDAEKIEAAYDADRTNVFRDNLFFQNGVVAPLFPFANRLTGAPAGDHLLKTNVAGQPVTMPLNNTAAIKGAIPHHLHGLLFGQLAQAPAAQQMIELTDKQAKVSGQFNVGPDLWTGQTLVTTTATLSQSGYTFMMRVKNIGQTPVPVGAGSHPYFASPDMDRDSMKIHVPARSLVEINNLSDVLPTGKMIALKDADPALNFAAKGGTLLHASEIKNNSTASRLDNLWVDLDKDPAGFAYTEVFYPRSHFKVRMTALTKNVIGIQGYGPKFVAGKRPFVALELVTNLPDPRKELWGQTPTGMTLLQPGETFEYGYKVELSAL